MCRERKEINYNGIKAGVWYTMGNILIKGIPFFTLPVFTRILTTSDFGIYNTYLAYEGILNIFIGLGIAGTIKAAFFDFNTEFEKYISSILKQIIVTAIIFFIIGNIGYSVFLIQGWLTRYIFVLLILQSLSTAVYGIMSAKFVITGSYMRNLAIAFSVVVLNIGISLVLCFSTFYDSPAAARITGTALASTIVSVVLLLGQQRKHPLIIRQRESIYSLRLGLPLIPHQLSLIIMTQCDKVMIQHIVGESEAGIYSLAANIVTILTVLLSSVDNAWAPWYYRMLDRKNFRKIREIDGDLLVFFMYLTCGFLLIGTDVIHIMTEKSYWDSVYTFIPLTVSVYLNFMYLYDINLEYFNKKTAAISYVSALCAVINIGLNIIFIKNGGYIAAAYATCIAKFMLFMIHHIIARKIEREKVVEERYLVFTLVIVLAVALLSDIFTDAIYMRYFMIVIMTFIILGYFYRKGYIKK